MKTKFIRLLLLSSFILVGCDNPFKKADKNNNEPEQQSEPQGETPQGEEQLPGDSFTPFKARLEVKMEADLKGSEDKYPLYFDYDDSFFLKDAEVYDKDLSLLSFGTSIAATYFETALYFFSRAKFVDIDSKDLIGEPTEDSLGYTLAHKTINDNEVFAVAIRGFEYKKEWENNFIIEKEGDHNGFRLRVDELYQFLTDYVNDHHDNKNIKLWICGYSRGGAISDLLASKIFRENEIKVNPKDMYVYTFEAPPSLCEENAVAYKNVHNIINSADFITHIPPAEYGLRRDGVDYEIYDANLSALVHAWDNEIEIPAYAATQGANNDLEFVQYVSSTMVKDYGDDSKNAMTRKQYVDNYQAGLSYSIGLIFAMDPITRSQMMNDLTSNPFNALVILGDSSGQSMANFMKTYLDMDHLSYENDELVSACAVLIKASGSILSGIFTLYMDSTGKSDMQRMFNMHYPEVTYCLLVNAHSKVA